VKRVRWHADPWYIAYAVKSEYSVSYGWSTLSKLTTVFDKYLDERFCSENVVCFYCTGIMCCTLLLAEFADKEPLRGCC